MTLKLTRLTPQVAITDDGKPASGKFTGIWTATMKVIEDHDTALAGKQPLNANLTTLAGLTGASGTFTATGKVVTVVNGLITSIV